MNQELKILENHPLKKITSTGVGGPARFFVKVKDKKELTEAIKWAGTRKLKWLVVGDGTNLIPADKGFGGLIIQNGIKKFQVQKQGAPLPRAPLVGERGVRVNIGAGNNLFISIRRLNRLGLAGIEKMAGIPGTVGGAIYGCAGAYGQEIKDYLVNVEIFDVSRFNLKTLTKERCGFNYRDSIFKKRPEWIIVGAEFKLIKGNPKVLQKTSAEIVKIRSKKYPSHLKCPGSFFKNIIFNQIKLVSFRKKLLTKIDQSKINHGKLPTAHLLELVGAKGMKRGGIAVSDYHANLIYNTGSGKSCDVKALADLLKNRVKKKFGIELEEEIRYLG